jgi:DNA-binding GntR family transcriptional regulator
MKRDAQPRFVATAEREKTPAGSAPAAVRVSSLAPTLAMRIVEVIRRENYDVGHPLREQALCDEFGVSRSPIRKALRFLVQFGVVTAIPNRGFQLARPAADLGGLDLSAYRSSEEDLYLRIANDRIKGALGEEIFEAELMERYGLSRLPLQRILHRMARESMIERKPGRGWVFRPLLNTLEAHRESYRFRMIIEPAAILEPGYSVDADELQKCRREQVELLDGGIERCTPAELFRTGVHFHETVIAGSGNRFLVESLRTINQMRRVVEYGTKLDRARLHRQCEEHLALIDLLERGERMEAAQFLRQHLNMARITKLGGDI